MENTLINVLPFYKITSTIIEPFVLYPTGVATQVNLRNQYTKECRNPYTKECRLIFWLTTEQVKLIMGKMNFFPFKLFAHIGCYHVSDEGFGDVMSKDCFGSLMPKDLYVVINNEPVILPPWSILEPSRRQPAMIDITSGALKNRSSPNSLIVSWIPEPHDNPKFFLAVYIAESLSNQNLLGNLLNNNIIPSEMTKQYIVHSMEKTYPSGNESNGELNVNLNCPINNNRLVYPAKGKNCAHFELFDAFNYILWNRIKPNWKCPICAKDAPYEDIQIFQYFIDILKTGNSLITFEMINIYRDGSWGIPGVNKGVFPGVESTHYRFNCPATDNDETNEVINLLKCIP